AATFRLGRVLRGEVLVGRDLIGELVLFHRSRVAGGLRRSLGVFADRVFQVFCHRGSPEGTTSRASARKKATRGCGPAWPCCALVSSSVASRRCRPIWLSMSIYTQVE